MTAKRKLIPLLPSTANSQRPTVLLSPMEEVNDPAFRMICKKAGAALTCTPLYSPLSPVPIILEDKPILQIFGPKELLQASSLELLADFMNRYDSKVSGWDFNLGCPATNAKQRSFGAYLTDVKAVEEIIKFMRSKTKKHLSMKIRKSPLSDDFLKIAEKYCDAISIHPRTREQGYSGEPDIKWAKAFKKKTKIPVIYSGNVDEINYKEFLKTFDYVMIGRKAIGHPEIFYHIVNSQTSTVNRQRPVGLGFKDYLILAEKYNVPWRIIKFQAMQFTKGDRGSRRKREKLIRVKDIEELKEIFFK